MFVYDVIIRQEWPEDLLQETLLLQSFVFSFKSIRSQQEASGVCLRTTETETEKCCCACVPDDADRVP
eukprot:1146814-Pelagomonas_calceolata.AAC.5